MRKEKFTFSDNKVKQFMRKSRHFTRIKKNIQKLTTTRSHNFEERVKISSEIKLGKKFTIKS